MEEKMHIPKTVKVLGRIYKVVVHEENKSGNDNLGSHWGMYSKIFLNKRQDQQAAEDCLLHEIMEAINYQLQLGLKHDQIIRITTGIYQIIKDNPKIFK
jgi:hypothetical protein